MGSGCSTSELEQVPATSAGDVSKWQALVSQAFPNNSLSIGRTPLVKLNRLTEGAQATVFVKIEGRNPAYSVKCRIGAAMIFDAEQQGKLRKGMTVIEPTSGNTGIALAMVCASRGYPLILTMPDTMSLERRKVMLAFGTKLQLIPGAKGIKGCVEAAEAIVATNPAQFFMPQQFKNPANPRIHEETTGPELWDQTQGKMDVFVAGVGTGGTITGVSRYFKRTRQRPILSVAVEPSASPLLTQKRSNLPLQPAAHKIQGIGPNFIADTCDLSVIDRIETVSNDEAIAMSRRLATEEGILSGISSGAAAAVAIRLAKLPEFAGKTIVTVLPDSGERYLSTVLFENLNAQLAELVPEAKVAAAPPVDIGSSREIKLEEKKAPIDPKKSTHPETVVLHAGYRADPTTGSVTVPIYQTTAYQFRDTTQAANLFALSEMGNIYTRIMNPTQDVLEKRLAALEGGVAALCVASGQAASTFSILNISQRGDNFVTSTDLYGGTWNLFANTFKQFGIEARFVDPSDPENFRRATDSKTRAYYAETLPNPKLNVFPVAEVARIGAELGVPLIVDNTSAPIIARPIEQGASIVIYSTTKYIGGHGTSVGGVLIDSGKFDWERHAARFPLLNEPDPSYHGARWVQAVKPLGPIAYIIRARVVLERDIGAAVSPFSAFQTIQGLETLPLRMREHCKNATAVAQFLSRHPKVSKVSHPSLQTGELKRRADVLFKGGYGALIGFELNGGAAAGKRFIEALKLFYHVANIGDARSLAIHPASTTHSQLSPEDQVASGVTPGYVRLSIGIEFVDDILADLQQALDVA